MATVSWYGRELSSVFGLLGTHEPALTRALGWTLGRSPRLLRATLEHLHLDPDTPASDVAVLLEDADDLGRTDIEVRTPTAHVIIEAKVGWILPGQAQLAAYAPRFDTATAGSGAGSGGAEAVEARLVTLSDSSAEWAGQVLPSHVGGVAVSHWSWDTVRDLIKDAKTDARGAERLWLHELEDYMGAATSTRNPADALAYCVVVSDDPFGGVPFRDYVTKQRTYFHPVVGGGWPTVPPNFLAFRWGNALRQLNRVTSYEVAFLSERFPGVKDDHSAASRPPEEAHVIYQLGPDIPLPPEGIPSGPDGLNLRAQRFWVLLDQLLTQPTLVAAREATKELGAT